MYILYQLWWKSTNGYSTYRPETKLLRTCRGRTDTRTTNMIPWCPTTVVWWGHYRVAGYKKDLFYRKKKNIKKALSGTKKDFIKSKQDFINIIIQYTHELWHWKEDFNTENANVIKEYQLHMPDFLLAVSIWQINLYTIYVWHFVLILA